MRVGSWLGAALWKLALRLSVSVLVWLAVILSAGLVLLAACHAIYAVAASLLAGISVRWMVQRWHLAQLRRLEMPARLAEFRMEGERLHCVLDEPRFHQYIEARKWRWVAAVAAGVICLALVEWAPPGGDVLTKAGVPNGWLYMLSAQLWPLLPLYTGLFFTGGVWPGQHWRPEARWARQAKAVMETRVAEANAVLGWQEIDGLTPAVEALQAAMGLEQGAGYRELAWLALEEDAASIWHLEKVRRTLDVCTEIARQDLRHLCAVLPEYRMVEQRLEMARALSPKVRTYDLQQCEKELGEVFEGLSSLVAQRRWEKLASEIAETGRKLSGLCTDLIADLQIQSAEVPRGVLAAESDPYHVLGISRETPSTVVRKVRLSLAQIYHPDIGTTTSNSRKMAEVNAAYDMVMKERGG